MPTDQQIALIPGANRPIGRAIARKFAEMGAALVLPQYLDWPDATEEMNEEFTAAGYDFISPSCDLTDISDVEKLITVVTDHYGKLDFLINNIERGGMPVVHGSYRKKVNQKQWDLEFDTTLKAKWNLFTCSLPLLQKSQRGSVVNISSIAAITGRSGPASLIFSDGYSCANRAVSSLTRTWSREGAPSVRVNEVMLGFFSGRHAEHTRGWSLLNENQRESIIDHILLKRSGAPEEAAEAVFFIAARATYMTGNSITIDGGYSLGSAPVLDLPEGVL